MSATVSFAISDASWRGGFPRLQAILHDIWFSHTKLSIITWLQSIQCSISWKSLERRNVEYQQKDWAVFFDRLPRVREGRCSFWKAGSLQDTWPNGQAQGTQEHGQDFPLKDFWSCSNDGVSPENVRLQEYIQCLIYLLVLHTWFWIWPLLGLQLSLADMRQKCQLPGPKAQHFQWQSFSFRGLFSLQGSQFLLQIPHLLQSSGLNILEPLLDLAYSLVLYSPLFFKDCCLWFTPFPQFRFSSLSHSYVSLQLNYWTSLLALKPSSSNW